MILYVLEARSDTGKVIARAEFDNRLRMKDFMQWLNNWKLVKDVRLFENDVEKAII